MAEREIREFENIPVKIGERSTTLANINKVIESVFSGYQIEKNDHLLMDEEYCRWVRQRRKTRTIRYTKWKVRIPAAGKIALIESSLNDPSQRQQIGFLIIKGLEIKRFSELTEEDARRDGFDSKEGLIEVLQDHYETEIEDDEPVSIFQFRFEPFNRGGESGG